MKHFTKAGTRGQVARNKKKKENGIKDSNENVINRVKSNKQELNEF